MNGDYANRPYTFFLKGKTPEELNLLIEIQQLKMKAITLYSQLQMHTIVSKVYTATAKHCEPPQKEHLETQVIDFFADELHESSKSNEANV